MTIRIGCSLAPVRPGSGFVLTSKRQTCCNVGRSRYVHSLLFCIMFLAVKYGSNTFDHCPPDWDQIVRTTSSSLTCHLQMSWRFSLPASRPPPLRRCAAYRSLARQVRCVAVRQVGFHVGIHRDPVFNMDLFGENAKLLLSLVPEDVRLCEMRRSNARVRFGRNHQHLHVGVTNGQWKPLHHL